MDIKDIHINPNNPRYIKDERYQKLKKSIQEFPKMMKLRPIIIDDAGMILGGNMRYLAMEELGYKKIPLGWVVKASELTEKERKRFIIADNIELGEFDYDVLANEWNMEELDDWGIELPEVETDMEEIEEEIKEYKMIHILISIKLENYDEISEELEKIKDKIIGIGEYEQSAN
jgi:ParB-like chromosome segregation protein Spo0J